MNKLKVMTIIGTRPEIIRLSAGIKACDIRILWQWKSTDGEPLIFFMYSINKYHNVLFISYTVLIWTNNKGGKGHRKDTRESRLWNIQ